VGNPYGSFPGGKSHGTSFGDFLATFDYQRVAFDPFDVFESMVSKS
jgi:hypothetical protein